jgi:hypothetical protein
VEYDEKQARKILEGIQDGKTLTTLCSSTSSANRQEVYEWLRDPTAQIDGRSFREAYARAEEDRRMTWRDMAILAITQFKTDPDRDKVDETWRLNLAQKKASMLMSASKETGVEIIARGATGSSDTPMVIIRRFLSDEELSSEGS